MKTKNKYYVSSIVAAVVLFGAGFYFWGYISLFWRPTGTSGANGVSSRGNVSGSNEVAQTDALARKGLESFVDNLKAAGLRARPSSSVALDNAVKTRDQGDILRAFSSAIYGRGTKMSEIIPILKGFLSDPDPFVRLNAASDLFIVGDQGGAEALIALVREPAPISGIGKDVRVSAAETLAQFQVMDAAGSIADLYARTHNVELLDDLSRLGAQASDEITFPYVASANTIIEYGEAKDTQFLPQITASFLNSRKPSVRAAAAWTLATLTGRQDAIDYLIDAAKPVATDTAVLDGTRTGQDLYTADNEALQYIGMIQTPEAKQVLELALNSKNTNVVTEAAVNLVVNQGGSDAVTTLLVNQLKETSASTRWLPWDVALSLAARMPENEQVQSAGQTFSQKSGDGSWELYTVERKNWPVYSWVWSYVIEVRK